jgi:hypothetical protein
MDDKRVLRTTAPGLFPLCIFTIKEMRQHWSIVGEAFHSCNALSEPMKVGNNFSTSIMKQIIHILHKQNVQPISTISSREKHFEQYLM